MYKSEGLHNVSTTILPLLLHLLAYNCSEKFLFKKGSMSSVLSALPFYVMVGLFYRISEVVFDLNKH
jgi:hypothetical protein